MTWYFLTLTKGESLACLAFNAAQLFSLANELPHSGRSRLGDDARH
jgi:hypothetical protein